MKLLAQASKLEQLRAEAQQASELERSVAEEMASVGTEAVNQTDQTSNLVPGPEWWTDTMPLMSQSVLVFGFLLILTLTFILLSKKDYRPDQLLRLFGTLLIIISAVFLVVAGYNEKQIAPVIGLLGTVAGYLLGKSDGRAVPRGGTAQTP